MGFHKILVQVTWVGVILAEMASAAVAAAPLANRDCPKMCGNLEIPYPFGTTKDCYIDEFFFINCTLNSSTGHSEPRLSNFTVTNISYHGQLDIMMFTANACYNETGFESGNEPFLRVGPNYTISSAQNQFVTVGCDSLAVLDAYINNDELTIGCTSICQSINRTVFNGSCSGINGCCELAIPPGLKNFTLVASSINNHSNVLSFNPCTSAFVVKKDHFKFPSDYQLYGLQETVPMGLDWAIGNDTCEYARTKSDYVCGGNSTCEDLDEMNGYRCRCKSGYDGNPYLDDGCQDIDECSPPSRNNCTYPTRCVNTEGNYTCSCPKLHRGDGRKDGKGCSPSLSLINGVLSGSVETVKIFSTGELEKATNNYDERRILGEGGYGTVYRGVLSDNKVVAIKKSKICDRSQIEQFINEVIVLVQINHRNVVKLLGCCLETEVPLLVYEFVTNGTLYNHIHDRTLSSSLLWKERLKIAAETAGALAYLHSETSIPIIHRDVKSTNILLDDRRNAKVADFGASRLVPLDQTQLTTLVQGTLGYLDPEYFQTSQLTEKSDVYSFGVVMAELLTGKKALSMDMPENDRNLANCLLSAIKEDCLLQILDDQIVKEDNIEELKDVANLAKRCLTVKGEDRPTMKEVAMELEGLRSMEKHPWGKVDISTEETEYLLNKPAQSFNIDIGNVTGSSTSTTAGYESIRNQLLNSLADGR